MKLRIYQKHGFICASLLFLFVQINAANDRDVLEKIESAKLKVLMGQIITPARFVCNRSKISEPDLAFETFTSPVTINYSSGGVLFANGGTAQLYMDWTNAGGRFLLGLNGSSSNTIGAAYDLFAGTVNNTKVNFITNSTIRQTIDGSGNVGIGTISPGAKLEVNGNSLINGTVSLTTDGGLPTIAGFRYATNYLIAYGGTSGFRISNNANTHVNATFTDDGKLGIGTSTPTEKLSVNGNITAKKIVVAQTGWSDYVFNKDYKLRSLSSLETFIKRNKHLPDVPSANEVEEKGISVGDNQALLLKKIEELTLYLIEINKTTIQMKTKIVSQAKEIQKLKNRK